MITLTFKEIYFVGLYLEAFFYGFYSGIFVMYLEYQASKNDTKAKSIIFYAICALYLLSAPLFACDIVYTWYLFDRRRAWPGPSYVHIGITQTTLFGCCDFIAQFILIYRCWIVWARNIRVIIIPLILALAFLPIWLMGGNSTYTLSNKFADIYLQRNLIKSGLSLSLTVNAVVTGLIVFRIFKVFREVKTTSDDQNLAATGGSKLRHIIFILIESGMALFAIQFTRLMVHISPMEASYRVYELTVVIHQMLNGITSTIILVRTSMGLSFHEEKSIEEFAIESLRFAPNHPNSIPETGSIDIADQHSRDDDIGLQRSSNDIDLVER